MHDPSTKEEFVSKTPLIDTIVAKATELCRSQESYPTGDGEGALTADVAVGMVLSNEIQTDEQARQLFNEMVDSPGEVNTAMVDATDTLAELVCNIAYWSEEIIIGKVKTAIHDYPALIAAREAKYGPSNGG